ncbi:MAG: insulinase family protein [Acidobacteria bacterium]|nr:insulinase family protein [Acidobacteriota bacterium]
MSLDRPPITAPAPLQAPDLPGEVRVESLDNGLEVCLLHNPQAPIVTCALWYRVGARDETPAEAGAAHFLEHMMFKGSASYGPGEIDRRTQALGGSNNAFTSHDSTAYYFNFSGDRWQEALAIEADRMRGLTLDPDEVDSERQVILEELSMYEDEPWDALEQQVHAALFPGHPFGRPVIGTRESLRGMGHDELASFHRRFYRPDNAVLVLAGDIPGDALERVAERFAAIPGGAEARPELEPVPVLEAWVRVERRAGDVARLCLATPAPDAHDPDYAALRLLVAVLSSGRASRLHRHLVEERQSCLWVAAQVAEAPTMGFLSIALEVVPGVEPAEVETEVSKALAELVERPPTAVELDRARRLLLADWVFAHERVHQQALAAGFALSLFDLGHTRRWLQRALDMTPAEVLAAARRFDLGRAGVIGWSLPEEEADGETDGAVADGEGAP